MSTATKGTSLLFQTKTIPWPNIFAISVAMLTGIFIISAVGLLGPEVLHNAAHDIRHGLAFPCH